MLSLGILCIALSIFFLWVMMHGQDFINSHTWAGGWGQVAAAFAGWLSGATGNSKFQPDTGGSGQF